MQSVLISLIAILAASSVALPISMTTRQLAGVGGLSSPLTTVLQQVGKQVPSTMNKVEGALDQQKKNSTQPGNSAGKDGLGESNKPPGTARKSRILLKRGS
ncbi:hypothetical protein HD806DRAFT_528816 [Xylariaceae sp. AK1471]|nr:hypothetical protein HD806DRAFT_528816 [Xylariaceae sp. AK1471]